MSFVLNPSSSTSCTAFSNASASLSRSKEYLNAIAKLNIVAIGLATPCPAISGAEPCIGSYIALILPSLFLAPKDAEGKVIRNAQNQIDFGDNLDKANDIWEKVMSEEVEVEIISIPLGDLKDYGLDANMMKPLLGTLVVE